MKTSHWVDCKAYCSIGAGDTYGSPKLCKEQKPTSTALIVEHVGVPFGLVNVDQKPLQDREALIRLKAAGVCNADKAVQTGKLLELSLSFSGTKALAWSKRSGAA